LRGAPEPALELLSLQHVDLALIDLRLGEADGLALCRQIVELRPNLPVVIMTGHGDMESVLGAIRAGAYDFITKPIDLEHLRLLISRALDHAALTSELKRLREAVREPRTMEMIGDSPAMQKVRSMIERVAESDATVLVTGESGTGKELVARALHFLGPRRNGPFIPLNCAAMPANLLESELFGHVKGAFTDARRGRDGLLVEANGGTLFLDEIGELPAEMQPKLLRALQEKRVRPVGANLEIEFDARLVAATNRDLESDVVGKRFRGDLFYRINVVRIHVPPLRARGRDILQLAQHFIEKISKRSGKPVRGLGSQAAAKMLDYDWPGNVRELENAMERSVALARYDEIMVDDLPEAIQRFESNKMIVGGNDPTELLTLEELERRYIRQVLAAVKGNKTQAAEVLGLARRTLYRKLEKMEKDEQT
jgi:two-component system response regulator HydG